VALTKTATLADGGTAADNAGDVISYAISLANDGNMDLTTPVVTDPSVADLAPVMAGGFNAGDANQDGELSVGETWQYTAGHTVTQAEIDNGGVIDAGLAIANTASAATDQGASATASASVSIAQQPSLTLAKDGTFNDTNGNGLADPGETISYTFTEANTGNMTLHQVAVNDQGSGVSLSGSPIAFLAPGATTPPRIPAPIRSPRTTSTPAQRTTRRWRRATTPAPPRPRRTSSCRRARTWR
jgi:uncharacterized repeat protein (TIGR01451 family)